MIPNTGFKLDLPSASTAASLPHKRVIVAVTAKVAVRYEGHAVSLVTLKSDLDALRHKDTLSVIIASDGKEKVKDLTGVMNTVRELGITKIGIATKSHP